MAVNELDARTRAVEKMRADQGKEVEAYNAAENQLLAIRNEQKQNIAAARLEAAAAQQQNATVAQAAELVGSSSGATVQAPVNAATQGVLGRYGLPGPTVTKTASTQKSANTQQITKQNIVINNSEIVYIKTFRKSSQFLRASSTIPAIMITNPIQTITPGYSAKNNATQTGPRIISHSAITAAFCGVVLFTPRL